MTVYAPQINLPAGSHAPPSWDTEKGVHLPLDHIITCDAQGQPLSYVGDFVWDFTYYHPRKKTSRLSFWYWRHLSKNIERSEITPARIARIREIQYLMLLRIHRSKTNVGIVQLVTAKGLLSHIANFAEMHNCSVRDVLERGEIFEEYASNQPASRSHVLLSWINFLSSLDPIHDLGFNLAKPKCLDELFKQAKQYRDGQGQHSPLPTRIYLQLIQALEYELTALELHWPRIQAVIREAALRHHHHKAKGTKIRDPFVPELLRHNALEGLLSEHGCPLSIKGLTSLLTSCQRLVKLQIHVFSGMRSSEVQYLPYHCMEFQNTGHGRSTAWIRGVTTKLAGTRKKRTGWVTTEKQGFRAIRFAQKIADLIYEIMGITPSSKDTDKDSFPLFISAGYLPWQNDAQGADGVNIPSQRLHTTNISNFLQNKLFGVIDEVDLEELEAIDAFRDWANEPEFEIGKRWHLTPHQLRRSLALYANASGLVRSSSLRRQLQHITSEMSYYYGRGSVYAKNLLKDDPQGFKEHIALEWQDTEHEALYLAFTRDVLNADEPLCGPAGIFYDLQKKRGEVMSEQEVKAQLKSGRMAYKAHPLGGCTHVGACNKQKGLRLTSGICISQACKSLVGKHSQIIKLIPVQRNIVAHLDPNSIAFQMEKEELDLLEAAEKVWRQPSSQSGGAAAAEALALRGGDAQSIVKFDTLELGECS